MKAEIKVYGLVQGVGFRPFVAEAAQELSLTGTVCNIGGIVRITARGDDEALETFVRRLSSCKLPGSRVDEVIVEKAPSASSCDSFGSGSGEKAGTVPSCNNTGSDSGEKDESFDGFYIIKDCVNGGSHTGLSEKENIFIPPDVSTCPECERELLDESDRRYKYPFISCTVCGPRFSIMEALPYDRERTAMKDFLMCPECEREYTSVRNIRSYAQTIACEVCGPQIFLYTKDHKKGEHAISRDAALDGAVRMLKDGGIIAVKDIGGYHFCIDPYNTPAANRLKNIKNRENKPFAVMFSDIVEIKKHAIVSDEEKRLLESAVRPIVLVDRDEKDTSSFAKNVLASSSRIGAMLPCNPLQILLLGQINTLVMTSANLHGEPIITEDERIKELVDDGLIDGAIIHDRDIINALDDSIMQVIRLGDEYKTQIIRRARGIVPEPVRLPFTLDEDVLAAGSDLKAVFALGRNNMAYLSGHFSDLYDKRAHIAWKDSIEKLKSLTGIEPERICHDMHPGFVSAGYAKHEFANGDRRNAIQHHYAHIRSVIYEHDIQGDVLGVAYDGTGFGDDGTVWGGEVLICNAADYTRAGNFSAVLMSGGEVYARDAKVTLFAYIYDAAERGFLTENEKKLAISRLWADSEDKASVIAAALKNGINTCFCSSVGRLFDAVSALFGICRENTYEGECAIMLEEAAIRYMKRSGISINDLSGVCVDLCTVCPGKGTELDIFFGVNDGRVEIRTSALIAYLIKKAFAEEDMEKLAFEFHIMIADITVMMCERLAYHPAEDGVIGANDDPKDRRERISNIVLGGGTFVNRILLSRIYSELKKRGYGVYINEKVPCGDGGIALGQLCCREDRS